jgi:hypothetical protein
MIPPLLLDVEPHHYVSLSRNMFGIMIKPDAFHSRTVSGHVCRSWLKDCSDHGGSQPSYCADDWFVDRQ